MYRHRYRNDTHYIRAVRLLIPNRCLSLFSARWRDPRFASWLVPSSAAIWYQTQTGPHQDIMNDVAYYFSRGYRALNSPARFRCRISYGWAGSNKFRPGLQGYYKKHSGVLSFERKRRFETPSLFLATIILSPFREMVHSSHARYRLGLQRNFTAAVGADAVMSFYKRCALTRLAIRGI